MSKRTFITAIVFGLPWSVVMSVYYSFQYEEMPVILILLTFIMGSVFGLVLVWSIKYMARRLSKKVEVEIERDETVIREAGANHFRGMEGVGGKLVLTNRRLIFKSHKINVQNHQWDFELSQIESVNATHTWNLLDNGLIISLANDQTHKFIVDDPGEWVEVITKQKLSPRMA